MAKRKDRVRKRTVVKLRCGQRPEEPSRRPIIRDTAEGAFILTGVSIPESVRKPNGKKQK